MDKNKPLHYYESWRCECGAWFGFWSDQSRVMSAAKAVWNMEVSNHKLDCLIKYALSKGPEAFFETPPFLKKMQDEIDQMFNREDA